MTPWTPPSPAGRLACVLGVGVLGRRIAACWASAGYKVQLRDPDRQQIDGAFQFLKDHLERYNPGIDPDDVPVLDFQDLRPAVEGSWLVIKCGPEKLDLKVDVFAEPEELTEPDAILATNSSSYKSREITAKVRPETTRRMLNTHYLLPPDIRIVELMASGTTPPCRMMDFIGLDTVSPIEQHYIAERGLPDTGRFPKSTLTKANWEPRAAEAVSTRREKLTEMARQPVISIPSPLSALGNG
ncbi:3-hydroxybutyryl-CoA dehydrogenase [Madurella mycetomatis]|uniref:3-hydroxybutyryl-CoA dehydrogenase n=1 Tax=Madurella mycetomatis TaxID=100816 RepID=A0A175VSI0_9PEZI|nr:3-hydroxybutyryl-CoA dehydrogenase [Madurella mycetomatis]